MKKIITKTATLLGAFAFAAVPVLSLVATRSLWSYEPKER